MLSFEKVSTTDGLAAADQPRCGKGYVLIRQGVIKVKRYTYTWHRRTGQHRVRWGCLDGATVCRDNGEIISVVFNLAAC